MYSSLRKQGWASICSLTNPSQLQEELNRTLDRARRAEHIRASLNSVKVGTNHSKPIKESSSMNKQKKWHKRNQTRILIFNLFTWYSCHFNVQWTICFYSSGRCTYVRIFKKTADSVMPLQPRPCFNYLSSASPTWRQCEFRGGSNTNVIQWRNVTCKWPSQDFCAACNIIWELAMARRANIFCYLETNAKILMK